MKQKYKGDISNSLIRNYKTHIIKNDQRMNFFEKAFLLSLKSFK